MKNNFSKNKLKELKSLLINIPDFRTKSGKRHRLISILCMAICATICGSVSNLEIAEWAAACSQNMLKRLGARYDYKTKKYIPPSISTFLRVLQNIDGAILDEALNSWTRSAEQNNKENALALDGKVLKGAKDDSGKQTQLLSVVSHNQCIVFNQCNIDSKTNEIPMAKELLQPLDVKGRVITADAMHTQTDTARFIVEEKKADYVFTVKDNQKNLNDDIKALGLENTPYDVQTVEKGHGRIETRTLWMSDALNDYLSFPYVGLVYVIMREVIEYKTYKYRSEIVSGITSLTKENVTSERLLQYNREHWTIEDRLHYVRDVTFNEDGSQIRTKNGPRVMASLRNFAISVLNLLGFRKIAQTTRSFFRKPWCSLALFGF